MQLSKSMQILTISFLLGCEQTAGSPQQEPPTTYLTPGDFEKRAASYDGMSIVLRGYLYPIDPDLELNESESAPARGDPIVLIIDPSLRGKSDIKENYDESDYIEEIGCAHKYVELAGVAGFIKPRGYYGIVKIESIRTFSDGSFSGSGELCYSAVVLTEN